MTVDWKDPEVLASQYLLSIKVFHFCAGMYIWEFLSSAKFEIEIYQGQRKFRWVSLVYLACRYFVLSSFITGISEFNYKGRVDCQVWVSFLFAFGCLAWILATALLALWTFAFWCRNVTVLFCVMILCVLNVGCMIYVVTLSRAVWNDNSGQCIPVRTGSGRPGPLVVVGTNFVLLSLMVFGVWRKKIEGGLWKMIYYQGIIWVFSATLGIVPVLVFVSLDLNDPMNLMFITPAFSIMCICATRMYRDLCKFTNSGNKGSLESAPIGSDPPWTNRPIVRSGGTVCQPINIHTETVIEVHKAWSEELPTSQ